MNIKKFRKKVNNIVSDDNVSYDYLMATNEHIEDCIDELYSLFIRNNISDDDTDILLNKIISTAITTEKSVLEIMSSKDKSILDTTNNTINIYFDEVGKIYDKIGDHNDIEYCENNRELLIKSNLKTVIYIAKIYRNKGVDFEDLISAGNLGLCVAFDKFKPNDIKIRKQLIEILDNMTDFKTDNGVQYYQSKYVLDEFSKVIRYGKLHQLLVDFTGKSQVFTYDDLMNFIDTQVCGARFNSVATMWIRAMILAEIKNSSLIRRPDSARLKSKRDDGVYNPDVFISINRSISDDNRSTIENLLETPSDGYDEIEYSDKRMMIRDILEMLMHNVTTRDRRIFLKKFGVGLPRPLQPKEIAQQEDLSIARVSQIFQQVLNTMRENAKELNISDETIASLLND